jgi:hypothetical protein
LFVSPLLSSQLTSIAALEAEREHRVARHRLADLALDHRLAVHLHRQVLDEVRLPFGLLLGRHGVRH